MSEPKEVKDFSPREIEIMAKAWHCMTSDPQVDYNKLAEECGMTNPRSASNAWANIKKKMWAKAGVDPKAMKAANGKKGGEGDGDDDAASGAGTPAKATPKKRGKKAEAEDGAEGSPAKKARTPAKKGKKAAGEDEVEKSVSPVKKEAAEEEMEDAL